MVSLGTVVTAAFLLGVAGFTAWIVWESLRHESHTPKGLREQSAETADADRG
jgi:uncharacterized membrane protein